MLVEIDAIKTAYAAVTVKAVEANNDDSPFWAIDSSTETSVEAFLEAKGLDPVKKVKVQERTTGGRKWIATGYEGLKAPKGAEAGDVFTRVVKATATRSYKSVAEGDVVAFLKA